MQTITLLCLCQALPATLPAGKGGQGVSTALPLSAVWSLGMTIPSIQQLASCGAVLCVNTAPASERSSLALCCLLEAAT